ncbi:DUF4255 domain-containing protein [Mangrovivirga cuniculi]|uniref:DUF4255 domain-containing protein n=1 Tax=Mangrovivirga cuniculi TaxID=2715131 RepID=A0A4D7K0X3_9BACT|nr:DUF4255 domain-containing protein [Mangrovivirga cuniculi]QCK14524.1 DUF4255 domain-containing protein [Mangrovivirga cuniculi]
MIYSAVQSVADALNDYLSNRFRQPEEKVIISNIINMDGSAGVTEPDKIILTLANLEQETINQKNPVVGSPRPVKMNLFILITAAFEGLNYPEGLKYLSGVISYFQSHKVMNHQNTPDLDPGIEKLSFEIYNQNLQNLSHLWGSMGGKYMPSILYKVRVISFDENNVGAGSAPFTGLGTNI